MYIYIYITYNCVYIYIYIYMYIYIYIYICLLETFCEILGHRRPARRPYPCRKRAPDEGGAITYNHHTHIELHDTTHLLFTFMVCR